ncbi:hypothetical protein CR513_04268, partial [Mucuna pruriens]
MDYIQKKRYGGSSEWKGKEKENDRARREKSPKKGNEPSIGEKNSRLFPHRCLLELVALNSVMIVKDGGEIGSGSYIG